MAPLLKLSSFQKPQNSSKRRCNTCTSLNFTSFLLKKQNKIRRVGTLQAKNSSNCSSTYYILRHSIVILTPINLTEFFLPNFLFGQCLGRTTDESTAARTGDGGEACGRRALLCCGQSELTHSVTFWSFGCTEYIFSKECFA